MYAWQLTVLIYDEHDRCRVIQWTGTSTNAAASDEQMTQSIYRDWLLTPEGRQYGALPLQHVRLYAVRTDDPGADVRQHELLAG